MGSDVSPNIFFFLEHSSEQRHLGGALRRQDTGPDGGVKQLVARLSDHLNAPLTCPVASLHRWLSVTGEDLRVLCTR